MTAPRKDPSDSTAITPRETAKDGYIQIAFHLPRFYLRVLDGEAEFLGGMRRSQVLELLVLRKAGLLRIERSPSAPTYRMARGELDALERYIWHCRSPIKTLLDRLRHRLGNVPPRSWVILALNEWIGLPSGVSDLDEPPTEIKPRRGR